MVKLTGKPIRISGSSNYSNLVISVIVLIDELVSEAVPPVKE